MTQASAIIESTPNSDISAKSRPDGITHANGVATRPSSSVAAICPATSTVLDVLRSMRVAIIETAKNMLPANAISAGKVRLAAVGRKASSTPAKPMSTAVHRRQPTRSCNSTTESAVT